MFKEYGLYNKKGELVHRGTASQLADKVFVCTSTIYICEKKNRLLAKEYTVKYLGMFKKPTKKDIAKANKKPIVKEDKEEKHIDYLTEMLNRYGNTISTQKPTKKMLNELSKRGFDVDVKVYEHKFKRHKETDYILTAR